jgi:hypothetical protein
VSQEINNNKRGTCFQSLSVDNREQGKYVGYEVRYFKTALLISIYALLKPSFVNRSENVNTLTSLFDYNT